MEIHEYQQAALKNTLNTLYYYFEQNKHLANHYKTQTQENWKKQISYSKDSSHFGLLGQHFNVEDNDWQKQKF